jgi:hypothetical protein
LQLKLPPPVRADPIQFLGIIKPEIPLRLCQALIRNAGCLTSPAMHWRKQAEII